MNDKDYPDGSGKAVGYALGVTLSMLAALLIGVAVLLCSGCKSHKTITMSEESNATSYIDTTKTEALTITRTVEAVDTSRSAAKFENRGLIEFVDGGGTLHIDTAGNVTFEGIKSVRGRQSGSIAQSNAISQKTEQTAENREQINGVELKHKEDTKLTEEKEPKAKWHETAFTRLGQGVFIAALLWLLFLYLRRKR